ncbi:RNA polymerase II-associated protein [Hysterangium stoloniferum]|nr:RNA polymerase II-associated protein [Hysterangium stoloniferum]
MDDIDMERTPSPGPPTRSIEVILPHEIIIINLDESLDPNPEAIIEILLEGNCKVWMWTKLAGEYWRRGQLNGAEKIALAGVDFFKSLQATSSLPPVYTLLANIRMARARQAPKMRLEGAQRDILVEPLKDVYYKEAAQYLNDAATVASEVGGDESTIVAFLSRGILQLAQRNLDNALSSFDGVLSRSPTNLIALMGKARVFYAQRKYQPSLKLFQDVLRLSPTCTPDPRIGIGLCLWALGNREKAKAAWRRSLDVNPDEWPAQLLLGIEQLNQSKDYNRSEASRADSAQSGYKFVEKAFNTNKQSAAAANVLSALFLRKGNYGTALKLAERTIQYADTLVILSDGYIRAALVSHAEGEMGEAMKHYMAAKDGMPSNILANVGLAQMYIHTDEIPAAIDTLDRLLTPPNPQKSLEAMIMLASLRAHPRRGVSAADASNDRLRARDLFERICKEIQLPQGVGTVRRLGEDMDMWIELARLWEGDNLQKTIRAYKEASRVSRERSPDGEDPRLLNNLAALRHLEGTPQEARAMYEEALVMAKGNEELSTTILYNLARCYEDLREVSMAQEAYDKLLARHPEYTDAKIRQAQMLQTLNQVNEAHELLKQALASQSGNLNLRAFYTFFLLQTHLYKPAKDFAFATLKDHDKHDIYTLCAAGFIIYTQARESRDPSADGQKQRRQGFVRAAELYEKALSLDPMCAVAAQGLAIVVAEDALGPNAAGGQYEDAGQRAKNAREALDVFAKVRESVTDGSVYANMGHCHYARDEFERAIESYETASRRFYNGQNVPVLLCLSRSWYGKANKDQKYDAMQTALKYAQAAFHLHPSDKAILYNIAMIQQKATELLFAMPPAKRSLEDLKRAIDQANHAQKLFGSLAADKAQNLPYNREIADQRRKYGESMLRKGAEHLGTQEQYETEMKEKLELARQKRQEEKDRINALERERMEKLRIEAEELAKQRRQAREEALAWTAAAKLAESDEEKEKRSRKTKKPKAQAVDGAASGDEVPEGGEKKKKRKRVRKHGGSPGANVGEEDREDEAVFSGAGDVEEPRSKKRVTKKRVKDDDDDEPVATTTSRSRKQFKSKEVISDSDEEM